MTTPVKDRRSILALIAGGLAASTAAVAGIATAKDAPVAQLDEGEEDYSKRYFDLCKLFGQTEALGLMGFQQLAGKHCAEGIVKVTMILDGAEYMELLVMSMVGLVIGGHKTEEEVLAMFSPEAGAAIESKPRRTPKRKAVLT